MGLGAEVLVAEGVCVREQLEWVRPVGGACWACGNWTAEDPVWGSMYGMADTMAGEQQQGMQEASQVRVRKNVTTYGRYPVPTYGATPALAVPFLIDSTIPNANLTIPDPRPS